jgi:outer membrane protein assembly factor BamB
VKLSESMVSPAASPAERGRQSRRPGRSGWRHSRPLGLACVSLLMSGLLLVAVAPAVAPAAPVAAKGISSGDWTQFMNGPAHLGYNTTESTLTVANVPSLAVAWTGTTGGLVSSSPTVANGVAYVGSDDGKLYAFAVGCAIGGGTCTPIWTGATGASVASVPAVSNGVVYVGSGDSKLYAFAVGCATGGGTCTPIWTGATGGGISSSPTVYNGVVYVGSNDAKVYAFAVGCNSGGGTCSPVWTGATAGSINSSPAVSNNVVYVGSADDKVYAFAVGCNSGGGTCSPVWTGTTGGIVSSSPAVSGGVVYVGSWDHKLYAYAVGCNSGGGACSPVWTGTTGAAVYSSPAVASGVVYVGSTDHKLYAYAVGCNSGGGSCTPLWTGTTGWSISSSPAVANGVVYIASEDSRLWAFAVGCGSGGGSCSSILSYSMGGYSDSSPSVTNGVVYLGSSDHKLYAFDLSASLYSAAATYTAIAPARVLDTRPTGGVVTNMGLSGAFIAGTVRTFGVADVGYVGGGSGVAVPPNATAVTGNLTVTGQTAAGLIALGPTMTPSGETTTINFVVGDNRANNVTLGLAPGGTLSAVYRSTTAGATVHLIFDVTGYFTPNAAGATYHTVAPGRVLDSRPTTGGHTNIGLAGKFKTKVVRTLNVSGVVGLGWLSAQVPVGATAVTGNLTVTNATSNGYVALGPTMTSTPKTSTLNVKAGDNRANGVTVALSSGKLQAVWIGTTGSSTDVIFDVTGYFTADFTGLDYYPIAPVRLLDSSTNKGLTGLFISKTSRPLTVGGVGDIPADAQGISGNLTLVGPSSAGFAYINPTPISAPASSTVNAAIHATAANGFDVSLSSGNLSLIWWGTVGSTANLQLDVTGYWK